MGSIPTEVKRDFGRRQANFGPFSRSERSEGRSGFLERLTTQLFLSTTSVGQLWEVDKNNWVVNLSKKSLLPSERSLLEKGPKFARRLPKSLLRILSPKLNPLSRIYLMNLKIKYEPLRLHSSYGLLYLIATSLKKKAKLYMS